jgi:hypothetical protein
MTTAKFRTARGGSTPRSPTRTPSRRTGARTLTRQPPRRPGDRQVKSTTGGGVRRRPIILLIATVLAVAVVAIARQLIWPSPHLPKAVCTVAIDAQGSTQPMASKYQQWLPNQISSCAKANRARVEVVLINGETSTTTTTVKPDDLSKLHLTGNAVDDDKIVEDEINRFSAEAIATIFSAPTSPIGTDLISTGCVVSPLLKHREQATLIIDSDGENNREPYIFGRPSFPMDSTHISTYIDQLRSAGQICNLSGVTVEWYGAGIGGDTKNFALNRLSEIRDFWTAYFAASRTTLSVYQRSL